MEPHERAGSTLRGLATVAGGLAIGFDGYFGLTDKHLIPFLKDIGNLGAIGELVIGVGMLAVGAGMIARTVTDTSL